MISPTREDVTRRAQELWRKRRCPVGQDNEIWLAAERQLAAEAALPESTTPDVVPADLQTTAAAPRSERHAKGGTKRASAGEAPFAPPISEDASLKAGIQKAAARAPIVQTKFAPDAPVAKSGKPLWAHTHAF